MKINLHGSGIKAAFLHSTAGVDNSQQMFKLSKKISKNAANWKSKINLFSYRNQRT